MVDNLTEGLNAEQLEAVTLKRESVLVLAGAGSGKTKVLTSRIAYLMKNGMATEESILAVTFTNKAAKEMKARISKLMDKPIKNMWIGTFHGLCYKMLREFSPQLGLPENLIVMDSDDQKAHVKKVMRDLGIDRNTEKENLKVAIDFINASKESGLRAKRVETLDPLLLEIYKAYEESCKREGLFDYAELMLKVNESMARNEGGMREVLRARFSDILVDEFQDTNPMQYEWLDYLRKPETVVMAVGDDDQSIYAFRGANPQGMQDFVDSIEGGRIIRLEKNYRSTGNILGAANAIIENNTGRIGKKLIPNSADGDKIFARNFEFSSPTKGATSETETQWIAANIKRQIAVGKNPNEIAILYRSNSQAAAIERQLARSGVPYTVYGSLRFFERQEVKDVIAYLRLAVNNDDMVSFNRIGNFPARGMGEKSMSKIVEGAREEGKTIIEYARDERKKGNKGAANFADVMDDICQAVDMLSLPDAIEYIIDRSGLLTHYTSAAKAMGSASEKAEEMERVQRMEELVTVSHSHAFENKKMEATAREALSDFLAEAALDSGVNQEDEKGKKGKKATVTMMTVHAGKGLEFDDVYISGMTEGVFPHEKCLDEQKNIEEERRLAYVAVTRARKNLFITSSTKYMVFGEIKESCPSRFVFEIPEEIKNSHGMNQKNVEYTTYKGENPHKEDAEITRDPVDQPVKRTLKF